MAYDRSGADDIIAVVEKLHVPHASRSGVNVIITDLDPKVTKSFCTLQGYCLLGYSYEWVLLLCFSATRL